MRPTLAAEELKTNLTQYLTTTFALADRRCGRRWSGSSTTRRTGIFRGPYLRIRTPFRAAGRGLAGRAWSGRRPSSAPYRHQAKAWRRLSTPRAASRSRRWSRRAPGRARPRRSSIPVLDHCRRAQPGRQRGMKALLLYPMNALATDQAHAAQRAASHARPSCEDVTAGLYIGDAPERRHTRRVMTDRAEIRRSPPDILLTNYKMLDLLLQRATTCRCGRTRTSAYLVLDEFHTYDGAQGTDVAMLLRRLAAATDHSRAGQPARRDLPGRDVRDPGRGRATTERDPRGRRAGVRRRVRRGLGGRRAPAEPAEEFLGPRSTTRCRFPTPQELAVLADPRRGRRGDGGDRQGRHRPGAPTRRSSGGCCATHILDARAAGRARRQAVHGRRDAGPAAAQGRLQLGRGVPALPAADRGRAGAVRRAAFRGPEPGRRVPAVPAHRDALWIRPLSRLLRVVSPNPRFAWFGEPSPETETTQGGVARESLPAVYCRHCGRSGWAVLSPEKDPDELVPDPAKIYRAAVSSKRRVRPLIAATQAKRSPPARPAQPGAAASSCSTPPATASVRWTPTRIRAYAQSRCSVTSGTTRTASTPPSTTGARRAGWTTAAGSSARAWPAWPRSPSPSCSPAGSSGPAAQDAAVQRRGAGRGAPGRVRRQPLVRLLPAHARRGDPARRRRHRER